MINRKPCVQQSWYILGLCTSVSTSLNRLKKTTRNLTQNNQSLLQYSWLRALKYEKEVITSQLYSSVPDTPIHKKTGNYFINKSIYRKPNNIRYMSWCSYTSFKLYFLCTFIFLYKWKTWDLQLYINKHGNPL